MKKLLIIPILMLAVLSSCKNEEKETEAVQKDTATIAEEMNATTPTDSLKFNPAHGVAGHRCDLPVGAALDQPTQMNSSPVRLQSATPVINPPHGEPGHDCSKPVGARL